MSQVAAFPFSGTILQFVYIRITIIIFVSNFYWNNFNIFFPFFFVFLSSNFIILLIFVSINLNCVYFSIIKNENWKDWVCYEAKIMNLVHAHVSRVKFFTIKMFSGLKSRQIRYSQRAKVKKVRCPQNISFHSNFFHLGRASAAPAGQSPLNSGAKGVFLAPFALAHQHVETEWKREGTQLFVVENSEKSTEPWSS